MAKNLLITKLPEDINQILDLYKERNYTRENTKAAMGMIREYPRLKEKVATQADRIEELEEQLSDLAHHLKTWQSHEKMVWKILKQVN